MNKMATSDTRLALRLPSQLKNRLEQIAQTDDRSSSYVAMAAITQYVEQRETIQQEAPQTDLYEIISKYRGLGVLATGEERTVEEIDASIRDSRDDA